MPRRPSLEVLEDRTVLSAALDITGTPTLVVGPNVNVSNLPAAKQTESALAINPANPLNVVALTPRIGGVTPTDRGAMDLFVSKDGGKSWADTRINETTDGYINTTRVNPSVAFDANGVLYLAYGVIPASGLRRLLVARSDNGGTTINRYTVVAANASLDQWAITAGRDINFASQQNVYITYTLEGHNQPINLSASTDGGRTFSLGQPVNDVVAGVYPKSRSPVPAVGPGGEVYVIWDDLADQPSFSSLRVDVSLDAGATFGADSLVATTAITGGNANGFTPVGETRYHISAQPDWGITANPSLVVDTSGGLYNGRLYASYTVRGAGASSDDTDVVVRYSDDLGQTWSDPVAVHGVLTGSQFLPALSADPKSGALAVAWLDTRAPASNFKVKAYAAVSVDGGATFVEAQLATVSSDVSLANPSRYRGNYLDTLGVAVRDGTLHAVWADNRGSASDLELYSARVSINGPGSDNVVVVNGDDNPLFPDDVFLVQRSAVNSDYLEVYVNGALQYAGLFSAVDQIQVNGLTGNDRLVIVEAPRGTALPPNCLFFDGGDGANTLAITSAGAAWAVTGANAGTVSGPGSVVFSNTQFLVGGAGPDAFAFGPAGSLSGGVDGGAGVDALDFSLQDSASVAVAGFGAIDGFNLSVLGGPLVGTAFANLDVVRGSAAGTTDQLLGLNRLTAWHILGPNSGLMRDQTVTSRTLVFSNVESLNGGSAADLFVVNPGGRLSGSANGGAGYDTVQATGGAGADQLALRPGVLTHSNLDTAFSGMEAQRLEGLAGNDVISLDYTRGSPVAAGGVTVDGGLGTDTLQVTTGAGADGMVLTAARLRVNGSINRLAFLEALDLFAGGGDDIFNALATTYNPGGGLTQVRFFGEAGSDTVVATPSASAWLWIDGGEPSGGAATEESSDALYFALQGATFQGPVVTVSVGLTMYRFGIRRQVYVTGFEVIGVV